MARFGELLGSLLRRRTPDADPLPDAELLRRFARTRDQAAFELLVWRHGPMVLAACRRVLRDHHAAEDAFQAAFLVLARKATSVRGAAAGWLHRVALRVCLRMKRRRVMAGLVTEPLAPPGADSLEASEQLAALDEEVARLPDWLRVPLVVCHLQGQTAEHAAALLGIPRGTVLSRLAAARKRLSARLASRGITAAVAVLVPAELSAEVGGRVAEAATAFAAGRATDTVSIQLAREVLSMTTRRTVMVAASALVLVAGFGTGVGLVAAGGGKPTPTTAAEPDKKDKDKPTPAVAPAPADEKDVAVRREKLAKLLAQVEAEIGKQADAEVADSVRAQLRAQQTRLTELETKVRTARVVIPPDLLEQMENAQERLQAAAKAPVPADVLAAAVKLHPKVVEVQTKLTAKEDELRKAPKDDAARKKLNDEREELWKQVQAGQKQVEGEVTAYLRVPAVVEAQKAVEAADRKVQRIERSADTHQQEYLMVRNGVAELRKKLATLEPQAEDVTWLKEKRRRLKQELLELELREAGVGKEK